MRTLTAGKKLPRGISERANRPGVYRVRVQWEMQQVEIGEFTTLGDAKAALALARADIARRTFVPPAVARRALLDARARELRDATTVRAWSERWLTGLTNEGRSPGTVASYRSTVRVHVLPTLGATRLLDVTPEDVEAVVAAVTSPGARNNTVRALSAMFKAAVLDRSNGLIVSPVTVEAPKVVHSDHVDSEQIASPAEVRAFTAAMPEALRIAVPLAAWCALRLGEVLGLQRRDFENLEDDAAATVAIRRQWHTKTSPPSYGEPKAGSRRRVSIPALLLPELRAHLEKFTGPGPEAPLLPSRGNLAATAPIGQTAFDRAWREAREAVRPGFVFHGLRHTGLTEYARAGATIEELKRRGGHRNLEAAFKYQHASAERDRTVTDRLNAAIGEVHG